MRTNLGIAHQWLQWGRRLLSTESHTTWRDSLRQCNASMGPPTVVDGKGPVGSVGHVDHDASMGPPTVVDGKVIDADESRHSSPVASMGPPTVVDGKVGDAARARLAGRGFNGAADCCRRKGEGPLAASGSVSGLQWGRRLLSTESHRGTAESTSAPRLQWGRRLLSTERRRCRRGVERQGMLQWGRRLLSTESGVLVGGMVCRATASMGPPTVVDGKFGLALGVRDVATAS